MIRNIDVTQPSTPLPEYSIIRLTPDHASAYRALMLDAYTRHPDAFTSTAHERAALPLRWWEQRLATDSDAPELVFGAMACNQALGDGPVTDILVGVAGLGLQSREKTRHKATLFGMVVSEAHRHQGLGLALVNAVIAHAQTVPALALLQLTVTHGNASAMRLYSACGFVPFGTEPMAVQVGTHFLNKVHMWRRVTCAFVAEQG